jgi:O-antigen/teichoic acid export membrane protein
MIRFPRRLDLCLARASQRASCRKAFAFLRFVSFGAVVAFMIKVASIALTYLQTVILARCMTSSGFGEYAIGLSLATALGVAVGVGQPTAIIRFWPQYVAQGQAALATGAVVFGYAITGISCLIFAFSTILLISTNDMGRFQFLSYAVPLTIAWTFSELLVAILRAEGRIVSALLPRDVLWRAVMAVIGLAAILSGVTLSSETVLLASASILLCFVSWQTVYQTTSAKTSVFDGVPAFDVQCWMRTGIGLWLATMVGMLNSQLDTPMVGLFLTSSEAGAFFIVQKTAGLLTTALWASIVVSVPLFSRLYYGQQTDELRKASALFAVSVAGISLAIYGSYLVFGPFILRLFGGSYSDLMLPLMILSTGYLIDAFCGPAGVILLITGHERLQLRIQLVALLAKLAMQPIIIPRFGLTGAIAITCAAQALVPLIHCIWIRRLIGIDPSIWGAFVYFWRLRAQRKSAKLPKVDRKDSLVQSRLSP